MTTIVDSLQAIRAKIATAAHNVGRNDEVQLLAVSKGQGADKVRAAYEAGQRRFGENYAQEGIDKQALLQNCAIEWHFVGPIQSNKTKLIAQHFHWVHSVDRLKIAERLSQARPDHLPPLNVCLQFNSSAEASKSGSDSEALQPLAAAVAALPKLRLRGLMSIPAPASELATQRAQFKIVREAFIALQYNGYAMDTLSIGMSDDFAAAIAEGSTMVRIGTAIFGARTTQNNALDHD